MTRLRKPQGWCSRPEGGRADLSGTWLAPERAPGYGATLSHRQSYRYWTKIHWATPPWLTDEHWEMMREIYEPAVGGIDEVDHIVPLAHPLVCGLNVPWNLRRVPCHENKAKSNNYWPDCPDHLCPKLNLPPDMFGGRYEPYQQRLAL